MIGTEPGSQARRSRSQACKRTVIAHSPESDSKRNPERFAPAHNTDAGEKLSGVASAGYFAPEREIETGMRPPETKSNAVIALRNSPKMVASPDLNRGRHHYVHDLAEIYIY